MFMRIERLIGRKHEIERSIAMLIFVPVVDCVSAEPVELALEIITCSICLKSFYFKLIVCPLSVISNPYDPSKLKIHHQRILVENRRAIFGRSRCKI